ncbi:hypothetical protein K504DRAFT_11946 [Pleomassaria siparia CBS 279.74]|uniref:Secreted protein n=1 Tax=Pleomassaria siparia CBS 279.74 TaxID=1314801 RepID=A0A6G1KPQ2_9PLEO|nr:hypothetical protein K504DRAFT_11946 [Pleomassaria siparia CBS 279.74]
MVVGGGGWWWLVVVVMMMRGDDVGIVRAAADEVHGHRAVMRTWFLGCDGRAYMMLPACQRPPPPSPHLPPLRALPPLCPLLSAHCHLLSVLCALPAAFCTLAGGVPCQSVAVDPDSGRCG